MKPPKNLGVAGRALWLQLVEQFDFDADPHRVLILQELCATADFCQRLSKIVDESESLRTMGSAKNIVAIPEVAELRQYRSLMANLVKALSLPDTPEVAEQKRAHLSLIRSAAAKSKRVTY